ncbi:MAG: hypothetical protein V1834_00300 [Candidatus Micrarchaeota archaeon]
MAKKKKTAKKSSKSKKTVSGKLLAVEKKIDKNFHIFMTAWKEHVHDEITIHKKILQGKTTLKQHVKDTIAIQERFLGRIKKML